MIKKSLFELLSKFDFFPFYSCFSIIIFFFPFFLFSQGKKLDSKKYSEYRLEEALKNDKRKKNNNQKYRKNPNKTKTRRARSSRSYRDRDKRSVRTRSLPLKYLQRERAYKKQFFSFDLSASMGYHLYMAELLDLPIMVNDEDDEYIDGFELLSNWEQYSHGYSQLPFQVDIRFAYVFGNYIDFKTKKEQEKYTMPSSLLYLDLKMKGGYGFFNYNLYPEVGKHSPIESEPKDFETLQFDREKDIIIGNGAISTPYVGTTFSFGGTFYQYSIGSDYFPGKKPIAFSLLEYKIEFDLEYWFNIKFYDAKRYRNKQDNRVYYIVDTTFETRNIFNPSIQLKFNFFNGVFRIIGIDYYFTTGYNFFHKSFTGGIEFIFSTRALFKTGFEK